MSELLLISGSKVEHIPSESFALLGAAMIRIAPTVSIFLSFWMGQNEIWLMVDILIHENGDGEKEGVTRKLVRDIE